MSASDSSEIGASAIRRSPAAARLAARREHSLLALAELARSLDLQLAEEELAQLALFNLVGHFGTPRGALWLRPENDGATRAVANVGLPADAVEHIGRLLSERHAAWPAGEVVNAERAPWLGAVTVHAREHGLVALARIEGQHQPLGWVALASPASGRFFNTFERELLSASLSIVSASLENQRMFRTLQDSRDQLAQANARMQELDRLRSEMLQNLNHEFRTPIAVILGAASCVRDLGIRDEKSAGFLGMIEQHAAQVRDMVTLLLDHVELMSLQAELPLTPTDVAACARDMLVSRAQSLAVAGRDVKLVASDDRLVAQADPVRLRRVLDELLTNAIKFSPSGTPVIVTVERTGPALERIAVSVADRGRGMSPEQLAVAFQPFRQGDGSRTRTVGGLGIGLTACHRILELMGGSLSLQSRPGEGTTARVEVRSA